MAHDTVGRQLLYALILLVVVIFLLSRAWLRERNEYRRFQRYRSTGPRQRRMRKWLLESFLVHGGTALSVVLLSWPYLAPLLEDSQSLPPVPWLKEAFSSGFSTSAGTAMWIMVIILTAVLVLPVLLLRGSAPEDLTALGRVHALLPRNRNELALGAALSVNAGIVEELLFRFGLPMLAYAASGHAWAAWLVPTLLFGAMHAYQGVTGVITTTILGALFGLIFLVSGSLLLVIVLHILFDVRSLVLLPVVAFGAHRKAN